MCILEYFSHHQLQLLNLQQKDQSASLKFKYCLNLTTQLLAKQPCFLQLRLYTALGIFIYFFMFMIVVGNPLNSFIIYIIPLFTHCSNHPSSSTLFNKIWNNQPQLKIFRIITRILIYSQLSRSNTVRGSCTGLVTAGPTMV